jgi:hypothetical protein
MSKPRCIHCQERFTPWCLGANTCLRCLEDPRRLEKHDRYVIDGVRHVATDELDAKLDVMDGLRFATKDEVAALLSRNPWD